jgi:alpha-galactosidase
MGVLEKNGYGYLAFEIEPKGCWSYEMEIVDKAGSKKDFAVIITGKTLEDNGWYKEIKSGETYSTEEVRLIGNADLDGVLEELTLFRRKIKVQHKVKAHEFVIYNNFQHNTWDNPTEQSDSIHIECASDCGADYYVVDAGWHDGRIDGHSPTQAIGRWFESKTNYPSGFIKTVEKARAFGMKFGLWMEIQSFGVFCEEPNLFSEDCFAHINGVRPIGNNRYHLDYTNEKVRDYFDKVFERVINDYNPDYIKVDYNQTLIGKDCEGGSISEGVCQQYSAYEEWFLALQRRYPDIIFETCSSGGMRNDAAIGRYSNVVSASDQGDYKAYPYIVANLPMSLLPEQSGIWNIAISFWKPQTDREKIAFNTINSLFGVMHLSSKLDLVNDELREIIREGGKYYKELAKIKETAIPVMPCGFTSYDAKVVFAGLKTKEKLYLSVFNVSESKQTVKQDLSKYGVKNAKISFPSFAENKFSVKNGVLEIEMDGETARMLELDV